MKQSGHVVNCWFVAYSGVPNKRIFALINSGIFSTSCAPIKHCVKTFQVESLFLLALVLVLEEKRLSTWKVFLALCAYEILTFHRLSELLKPDVTAKTKTS